ncbi:MAG: helix-hairpin-helix domain-containing protein [Saprospiraceae bacterium]
MLKKELVKSKATAKVTFTLPIDAIVGAKEVRVLGEFNNWDWASAPVMKANKTNYTATINLAAGKTYQFRYKADNGLWANDWAADNYVPAPYNVDNSVVVVPAKKATKKTAKADDLKKVEGIGPKIAGLLNEAGIITFADLAKAPIKKLRKVLDDAGSRFRMHDPKTWAAQAKLAAKGDWDKLKAWQGELKGGK